MTRLYRTTFLLGSAFIASLAPAGLQAQSFDTSGTASLQGPYLFRYVNFFNDQSGNLTESCTLSGTITFDGAGKYSLSNTQLADSAPGGKGDCTSLGGGNYGVQANGIAQLDNPLYPATLFGTFSQPLVIASGTEDDFFDLFVAVQAPASSASNSLLSGNFTVGTLDFPKASASLARQGYFTLNADGKGSIAAFTVNGSAENLSSGQSITQNVAASTYSLSGATGGTVTFPGSANSETEIISGEKILYVSADGNWLVGGSATGSDMLVGFRAPSGTSSNALLSGTYFTAGMEDASPTSFNFLDAFYGSINANGAGVLISHQRFDDVVSIVAYDNTFNSSVTIGADGSYYDGNTYTYLAGSHGAALMLIGSNQQFSLIIGIHAPSFQSTSGVWLDPIGITDAANFTPVTNSVAPGELVNLYGTFGVPTQTAAHLPLPTTIDGVQVLVNGQAAPLYLVSKTQISALVPYEVTDQSFATFQVVVNNVKSNAVTLYAGNSSPGLYTQNQSGIGAGAILHSDFTAVTAKNPAKAGETVTAFMTGLGPVTPQVDNGAAAPTGPLSTSLETGNINVFLDDGVNFLPSDIPFAGLAPGFAGLYQVNFTVPKVGLSDGETFIHFDTIEGRNAMATISLSGFSSSGMAVPRGSARVHSHRLAAGAVSRKPAASPRRALPERPSF